MRIIYVTKGQHTIIDDEDYESVSEKKWCGNDRGGYVTTHTGTKGKRIYLHRFIMNAPDGFVVDHINGDKFDNRKANLRIATQSQNMMNQRKRSLTKTSKYKGVSFHKKSGKWRADIKINKRQISLGLFSTDTEAASSYNIAASKHFCSFARYNEVSL